MITEAILFAPTNTDMCCAEAYAHAPYSKLNVSTTNRDVARESAWL